MDYNLQSILCQITEEMFDSNPSKVAVYSATSATSAVVVLCVQLRKAAPNLERCRNALYILKFSCSLLRAIFRIEANGKAFSDLHDRPVKVDGPSPSYTEGVYRWLREVGSLFRGITLAYDEERLKTHLSRKDSKFIQRIKRIKETYLWPQCLAEKDFAFWIMENIQVPKEKTHEYFVEILTGIEMESRKLGIDIPEISLTADEQRVRLFQGTVPQNRELVELVARLDCDRSDDNTDIGLARELTGESVGKDPMAKKLLGQIRTLRHKGRTTLPPRK